MKLRLDRYNIATRIDSGEHKGDSKSGKNYKYWSMVYDEGISIKIGNLDLFTYFQYEKVHGVKVSNCDKSLIGFYRNDVTEKYGCFYMTQTKKNNDISEDSKGNNVHGATLKLLNPKKSVIIPNDLPKHPKPVKAKSLAQKNAQQEKEDLASIDDAASVPSIASFAQVTPAHLKKDHTHKPRKVGNIFATVAKTLINHKCLKKASMSRVLKNGNNMQRGKSLGVNNYLGYVPFFAQTSEKLLTPPKGRILSHKKSPMRIMAKHLRVPNTKELYFDFDPTTMSKLGAVAQKDGSFIMGLGLTVNKGKVALKGTPLNLKKENDIGDFIIAAQVSETEVDPKTMVNTQAKEMEKEIEEVKEGKINTKNLVDYINGHNMGWKAANYDNFKNKSLKEFMARFKRKQKRRNTQMQEKMLLKKNQSELMNPVIQEKMFAQRDSHSSDSLPKSLNLREYLSPTRNQGQCGSCYLVSTVGMLEARVRYMSKKKKEFNISEQ
jgi:hypothetical protein